MNAVRFITALSIALAPYLQILSQEIVSSNRLIPGETNIIRVVNVSGNTINETPWLTTHFHYNTDFLICVGDYIDTIFASKVETINDTLVELSFVVPSDAPASEWTLSLTNGVSYFPMILENGTQILQQPGDFSLCLGGTDSISFCAWSGRSTDYSWYHNGKRISRTRYPPLWIYEMEPADTGEYYCVIEANDTITTDTIRLHLIEMPAWNARPTGPEFIGEPGTDSYYFIYTGEEITEYHWKLIPADAGNLVDIGDTSTAVAWNPSFAGTAWIFVESMIGNCRGSNSDTLWVEVAGEPDRPVICIVGLDETTEKLRIVWNRTAENVAFYNLYRESNQAGVYLKLASIPAVDPGIYIDSASFPNQLPHSYKLSVTDTLGNESDLSVKHTSMILQASKGLGGSHNLVWTGYIGFPFLSYQLYSGSSRDSMVLLQSIASNINSFTVESPPSGPRYYQIAVERPEGCDPYLDLKSDVNYGQSRSNFDYLLPISTGELKLQVRFSVIPNPARDRINLKLSDEGSGQFRLMNLTGKEILIIRFENGQKEIDVSMLPPGIYLLECRSADEVFVEKLLIR